MNKKIKLAKILSSILSVVAILGANTRCLVFVHEPEKPEGLEKLKFFK